jgi:hypothetical protein
MVETPARSPGQARRHIVEGETDQAIPLLRSPADPGFGDGTADLLEVTPPRPPSTPSFLTPAAPLRVARRRASGLASGP